MSNTDATPNQKIARDAELVTSHEDLADYINKLLDAYNRSLFEQQGVIDYLEGMEGVTRALDSWARNVGYGSGAPEQPDWRWVARLLHAAFYNS